MKEQLIKITSDFGSQVEFEMEIHHSKQNNSFALVWGDLSERHMSIPPLSKKHIGQIALGLLDALYDYDPHYATEIARNWCS